MHWLAAGLVKGRVSGILALGLLLVVSFLLLGARNVYAQTLMLTPNTVMQGQSFEVSGSGFVPGDSYSIIIWASGGCGVGSFVLSVPGTVDDGGDVGPLTLSSGSLSVGMHCVNIGSILGGAVMGELTVIPATTTTTTVTTPIPEYPYGLALLAIFMVLGYPVIKRRTRN